MRAGTLREKVTLKSLTETTYDTYGARTYATYTSREVWARVEPLSGREYLLAAQTAAGVDTRIVIRYTTIVIPTPKMLIVHGAATYDIKAVIDPGNAHREYVMMCSRSAT